MDAIIPALTHRIPSELRSQACLGESSTRMGDPMGSAQTTSLGLTGDGGVGRTGVTGGVMRRCAWRLGRWGAG
ncbi:hypothetical protein KY289_000958 [Solanum tuberosum]|nr:hypothetical protein KY289_000958 [Solanum tuberosum]